MGVWLSFRVVQVDPYGKNIVHDVTVSRAYASDVDPVRDLWELWACKLMVPQVRGHKRVCLLWQRSSCKREGCYAEFTVPYLEAPRTPQS